MSSQTKYLNGLAVTSIVFICLMVVPIGILAGIAFTNSEWTEQDINLSENQYKVIELNQYKNYAVSFWIESGYNDVIDVYVLNENQYNSWNNKSTAPELFTSYDKAHDKVLIEEGDYGDSYIVLYNSNENDLNLQLFVVEYNQGLAIAMMVLGIILALFVTLLTFHTVGYLIKVLIIVPIAGSKSESRGEYKADQRYYSYPRATQKARKKSKEPEVPSKPTAPERPKTPKQPSTPIRHSKPKGPALANISENFVTSKEPKNYAGTKKFMQPIKEIFDKTGIPERVLGIISLFFFLLGIFTVTWWNIFAMPLLLMGIASIVYYVSENRREKMVLIVEAHSAMYVRELTRLINAPAQIIQNDIWKIINLGLAELAYDIKNDIVFIPGIQDSEQAHQAKAEQKRKSTEESDHKTSIHQPLKAKKEEPKVEEEILCPFCDAKNPGDSVFCIKCGASLKPAK